jgi:Rhodopirellula transposase DDE domain
MVGQQAYPTACRLLITADSGGSTGYRPQLWKTELQKLANETGLEISVCHLPPGTSKWNKIEHRLFSYLSQNWRGKPLVSHEVIINLIASTTTRRGLTVRCELNTNRYPTGIKITEEELSQVNISRDHVRLTLAVTISMLDFSHFPPHPHPLPPGERGLIA